MLQAIITSAVLSSDKLKAEITFAKVDRHAKTKMEYGELALLPLPSNSKLRENPVI
jgi:hypothetical protein